MHNQPREPQPYEDCQAKSIQEFGWTSQGMDWGWCQGIKSTTHRRVKEFCYSCCQRCLTWAKEEKNWETKVLDSVGRVEKLIAQVAWSPVLSFHSLWLFGVQCHLLVLVHCVFWKPTSLHPFTKKCWSTSCFLLLTQPGIVGGWSEYRAFSSPSIPRLRWDPWARHRTAQHWLPSAPGVCSQCVCAFTSVCVHLDGLNAEHKFRVCAPYLATHHFKIQSHQQNEWGENRICWHEIKRIFSSW